MAEKLTLNASKIETILTGPNLVLGSSFKLMLEGVALSLKAHGVAAGSSTAPQTIPVAVVARSAYYQFGLVL